MGKAISLKERLCLNFCPYYKPTKREELSCLGFLVVERLLKQKRGITFEKSDKDLAPATVDKLLKNMCPSCPFYERDCDFVLHKGNSSSCGGFNFLGHLLELNIVTIDDIIKTIS